MRQQVLRAAIFFGVAAVGAGGCSCGSGGSDFTLPDPPKVTSLSPTTGSYRTQVTIAGTGFSAEPADLEVYFDGTLATIVSSTETDIVVEPSSLIVDENARTVQVSVVARRQFSNAHSWLAVESGYATPVTTSTLRLSRGIATDGSSIFVADEYAGILQVDPATTLVTTLVPISETLQRPVDIAYHSGLGRLIVADDFTTNDPNDDGSTQLRAVDPATGNVTYFASGDSALGAMTINDATGDLFLIYQDDVGNSHDIDRISLSPPTVDFNWGRVDATIDIRDMEIVGTRLFVSGSGTGAGIYELNLATGGVVNAIKALDVPINDPRAMLADGNDLLIAENQFANAGLRRISNLAVSPSNVVAASTFIPDLIRNARALTSFGGDWYWLYVEQEPVAQTLMRSTSPAQQEVVAAGLLHAFGGTPTQVGGSLYWTSLFACAGDAANGWLFRLNPDGTSERVVEGPCAYSIGSTSAGQIVSPSFNNVEILRYDPSDDSLLTLASAGDGLLPPYGVIVAADDTVYVGHSDGVSFLLAEMTADGTSFDANFGNTTAEQLIMTTGAELDGELLAVQVGTGTILSFDRSSGNASAFFPGTGPLIYSMTSTVYDTAMATHYDGATGGTVEIFDSGSMAEHAYGALGTDFVNAFAISRTASQGYWVVDLGGGILDAELISLTP